MAVKRNKQMKRNGNYPLYHCHRAIILDDFDSFLLRQQTRIKAVFAIQEEVRNEWKWVKEWVGKEGLQLEEIRK